MGLATVLAGLAASACIATTAATSLPTSDPSYVVQIHSSRDGFLPPPDASERFRTQPMTTESGKRFECFVPFSPSQKEQQALDKAAAVKKIAETDAQDGKSYITFARVASKKIRPMCLQYVDPVEKWVYEICPGVLIRKVSLRSSAKKTSVKKPETDEETPAHTKNEAGDNGEPAQKVKIEKIHEVHELAFFTSDSEEKPQAYEEFVNEDMQTRISSYKKPMYTQVFTPRGKTTGQQEAIQLQFLCSAATQDDLVGGIHWRERADNTKEPGAFVIASRVFCNAKHSGDADEKFTVSSLLQPLAQQRTCIKRNEGWWTYEFCFGQGIRQYHRENDGKVTAEFSLGTYDATRNENLESSGASLVTEPIDATHDAARPAFAEMYSGGTHCSEFDVSTLRKSRVLFFCNQGSANHHILAVKETQTCTYTIKISTPTVCDHPHFITEEQAPEDKAEIVHCIPVVSEDGETIAPEIVAAPIETLAPVAAEPRQEDMREVEVSAT